MRRMIMAVAAAALGLGTLAGCGGAEDSGNAQGGSEQSQQSGQQKSSDGASGEGEGEGTSSDDDAGQGDESDSAGSGDESTQASGGDVAAYCDAAKSMGTMMEEMSPEEGQKQVTAQLRTIADNAPAEVKGDWNTFVEAWDEMAEATAAMKGAGTGADVNEAEKQVKSAQAKMESVNEPIEKHLKANCGEL